MPYEALVGIGRGAESIRASCPLGRSACGRPGRPSARMRGGRLSPASRRGDFLMTYTHPGAQPGAGVVDSTVFARRYLAHAGSQLPGLDQQALAELAHDALAFGLVRPWGQTLLRLKDRDAQTTGLDIVSADAPYIVESLLVELERAGRPPQRVLHPQIVLVRDADGTMTRVYDLDDNADVPDGAM